MSLKILFFSLFTLFPYSLHNYISFPLIRDPLLKAYSISWQSHSNIDILFILNQNSSYSSLSQTTIDSIQDDISKQPLESPIRYHLNSSDYTITSIYRTSFSFNNNLKTKISLPFVSDESMLHNHFGIFITNDDNENSLISTLFKTKVFDVKAYSYNFPSQTFEWGVNTKSDRFTYTYIPVVSNSSLLTNNPLINLDSFDWVVNGTNETHLLNSQIEIDMSKDYIYAPLEVKNIFMNKLFSNPKATGINPCYFTYHTFTDEISVNCIHEQYPNNKTLNLNGTLAFSFGGGKEIVLDINDDLFDISNEGGKSEFKIWFSSDWTHWVFGAKMFEKNKIMYNYESGEIGIGRLPRQWSEEDILLGDRHVFKVTMIGTIAFYALALGLVGFVTINLRKYFNEYHSI